MGKIDLTRAVIGGLLAGLIINIGEFVLNEPILGEEWQGAMQSLNRSAPGGSAVAVFVIMGFVLGISAVWTYAAIRPRLGPGPRTAVCAGLLVWFFVYLYPSVGFLVSELFPPSLIIVTLIWGFFEIPLATVAGAWLYREEESTSS